MAEELPFGDFLLTYKITTMNEQIIIVTRQDFYVSRCTCYALASDNPVVGVWLSKRMVDDFFSRRIPQFIERGCTCEHVKEPNSTGVVDRYIIKDENGELDCVYIVTLEPVI